jgi:hypothetical protein
VGRDRRDFIPSWICAVLQNKHSLETAGSGVAFGSWLKDTPLPGWLYQGCMTCSSYGFMCLYRLTNITNTISATLISLFNMYFWQLPDS